MKKKIPYSKQFIDKKDIKLVTDALQQDLITGGTYVKALEKKISKKLDVRYCVSCTSATSGLHLASLALGLKKNDWVIVPTITFLATANSVRYVGADVWFSDVDPETGLMTLDDLKKAYNSAIKNKKKIKAVYLVHLNGQATHLKEIYKFARSKGLYIVEDASHAFGSNYHYKKKKIKIGSCETSDMTIFSFHPVKNLTTGEGGIITTKNKNFYLKLQSYKNHGMIKNGKKFLNTTLAISKSKKKNPWYYEMHEIGFNYRIPDLNCALGLSQIDKLTFFKKMKKEISKKYDFFFRKFYPDIKILKKVNDCDPLMHLYVLLIDFGKFKFDKCKLMNLLFKNGIASQVHYIPVHLQPYYKNLYGKIKLKGAMKYYSSALSIPFYPSLSLNEINHVKKVFTKYFQIDNR